MNVIQKFTLRSLRMNRKWTIVTIIGIIISTAMITAVSTFSSSFIALMQKEAIANEGNWHALFPDIKQSSIEEIKNDKLTGKIMLSRDIGYALLEGCENKSKPYIFIKQYDDNCYDSFPITLITGRMPQNDSEIVLSQHIETNGGVKYEIGDKLTLNIGKRVTLDGYELGQNSPYQSPDDADTEDEDYGEQLIPQLTKTYTVVGIIERPTFEPYWAPGYTAVTYLDSDKLQPDDTVNVSILADKLNRHFFDDTKKLAKKIGVDENRITYNNVLLRYYGIIKDDSVRGIVFGFAAIAIVIIIIASVSLIYNAFSISLSERTRQLGMLASVGATKRQKRQNVYFEGLIIGLIAIPIGVLSGIAGIGITLYLIRPIMDSFTNFSSDGLTLVVSIPSVVIAVLLAALTIFISAWIPARRASKIMPIDALRQNKDIRLKNKTVKTSKLTRLLFGFEGEIALKNIKRFRKKYRATVLSLIISLILFLTVSYYLEFGKKAIEMDTSGYNFDIMVRYTNSTSTDLNIDELNKNIAGFDEVKEYTIIKNSSGYIRFDDNEISEAAKAWAYKTDDGKFEIQSNIYCLDSSSFDKYAHSLGLNPQDYKNAENPKVIVINHAKGKYNDKYTSGNIINTDEGKTIYLYAKTYDDDEVSAGMNFEIGHLTDQRPMGIIFSSFNDVPVIMSEEVFNAYMTNLSTADDSFKNRSWQAMYLNTDNSEKLENQILEMLDEIGDSNYFVMNISRQTKQEQNLILFFSVFIYGFIILISLICIANIINTISTNIALRRKEFAMLRSVGMTPGSFNKMIRFESVFYGLKALLYGIPISFLINLLLLKIQDESFDFGFYFPWKSYITAIIMVFVIVFTTMMYSSAKIKKENIIDALKEE